jgi:diphosphomevalonate decarboxylase
MRSLQAVTFSAKAAATQFPGNCRLTKQALAYTDTAPAGVVRYNFTPAGEQSWTVTLSVVAQAQPNIALVKYWGKRDAGRNLPAVGSLSLTLDSLSTRMSVELHPAPGADRLAVNGRDSPAMLGRVSACLDRLLGTPRPAATIESESNFPVAAGLASSAAAFAALVKGASAAAGLSHDTLALARLAGAASGSAARSLFEGIVELRPASGDVDDIDVASIADAASWPLRVIVAVTDERKKPVGSSVAMQASAASSPFWRSWVEQQDADLDRARRAVAERNFAALAAVSEHNCLKMHSLMWTSRPPIVYWNGATLACMETVRELQRSGLPVFFTIDAGPQVKAVCLPEAEEEVRAALSVSPGVSRTWSCGLGSGARIVEPRREALDQRAG